MQIPILETFRELDRAPRKFLLFSAINVVSWQCIAGSVLVLFGREIGMPPSWVGFLMSFMPLSMTLVALTVPLVNRFGPRRLMLTTWLIRNLVACSVFTMPWATARWGPRAAWYVLLAATLGFCLARATGAGGWFPWLHEVVRPNQRGVYFSAETMAIHLVTVAVTFTLALILRGDPGPNRFLLVYGIGIAAGLFSLVRMARVPGGRALQDIEPTAAVVASYRAVFRDRAFLVFVPTAALCFSCTSWLGSSLVLYMRDALGFPSRTVMAVMTGLSAGILLTIRYWARFAEHSGSGRAMFLTLTAHSLVALACLTLWPGAPWTRYAIAPLVALSGVFGAACWMAAHRAMLNYVKSPGRVAYTNTWQVGASIVLGITPILAGLFINDWSLWGFRLCFLISGLAGLACAAACLWVVRDGAPLEISLTQLASPALPMRTLARILWVTVGLDESNRPQTATGSRPPDRNHEPISGKDTS